LVGSQAGAAWKRCVEAEVWGRWRAGCSRAEAVEAAVPKASRNSRGGAFAELCAFVTIAAVFVRQLSSGERTMAMDVVDYEIRGAEMQFVEVELDPGEAAIGEAGSLMFMDAGIGMDTVFGDGSANQGGLLGKLLGAGKRLVTGESLFTTIYTNQSRDKQRVAFAAPYPGKILPMDLRALGGTLLCQKDAFLAAARGVSLGIAFQQKLSVGFFGGEGFILQKLEGDGLAFVHAGGTVVKRELQPGQTLMVDTGCVVAFTPNVNFEIQYVGKIKTALFGGEGLFFAKLTGPGTVWLQSLPFSRLASRVFAAAPQRGGSREEGSLLGGLAGGSLLGGVLGGDDD
jgi:uncharacterized protein (TIGR00266 family)